MHIGENRTTFYVCLTLIIILLWYSLGRRKAVEELELEARLLSTYQGINDFHSCSIDSCIKLDRCLLDMDRIRVYVQPMVKLKYSNGKEMELPRSKEFQDIRESILNSKYYTPNADKACLIVPGVDLLNLKKFKSADEIQRVIESITAALLPPNSNLLLFNFIGIREPLHIKAMWASASMDQYTLRRKFDISIPMLQIYSLSNTTSNHNIINLEKQQWTVMLRFASKQVINQMQETMKEAVKSTNVSIVFLYEVGETEKDVNVLQDQNGNRRDYVDVLKSSTFTIIHDLVPGFQMLILDAMQSGSIPVIITDDYLPPFHELLAWSRFSILLAKQKLASLPLLLNYIEPELTEQMRRTVNRIYWHHLSSPHQIAMSTLSLIEKRILPLESTESNGDWANGDLIGLNNRMWMDVPIRSMASNFTIILAAPSQLEEFKNAIKLIEDAAHSHLNSILVLWPVSSRPVDIQSTISNFGSTIRLLNWDPNQVSINFGSFVDSIIHRSDTSKDCWLFMDLRDVSTTKRPKFNEDFISQSFSAWKENADSILSFNPYINPTIGSVGMLIDGRKQTPFFRGAAFIHPHAAQDLSKAMTSIGQWAKCSNVSIRPTDCETNCSEFLLEFCRPNLV